MGLDNIINENTNFLHICHQLGKVYNCNPLIFYTEYNYIYVLKLFHYCIIDYNNSKNNNT